MPAPAATLCSENGWVKSTGKGLVMEQKPAIRVAQAPHSTAGNKEQFLCCRDTQVLSDGTTSPAKTKPPVDWWVSFTAAAEQAGKPQNKGEGGVV